MREWAIKSGDPHCLVVCADSRFIDTSYINDQIWELRLRDGEPPALSFQTTFGLRAVSFRMFPKFSEGDNNVVDPLDFYSSPIIRQVIPNYLCVEFSPFLNIDVTIEYWVPHSQNCCGRIAISNNDVRGREIKISWLCQLTPINGERMALNEIQSVTVLSGKTSDLTPVLFVNGGVQPGSGSYPSLVTTVSLDPGSHHQLIWSQSALSEPVASFEFARSFAAKKWDAEIAYLEVMASSQLEIFTGFPEWDAAFMFSQNHAYHLVCSKSSSLPDASFVQSKTPDQGYSFFGNGADYNHLWNGQTALDTNYLTNIFLPSNVPLVEGFLRNFFAVQEESGFIDWKPGLANQRSKLLATPVLTYLVWKVYQYNQDRSFLEDTYIPLKKFLDCWISPAKDRDNDGYPEWDHPFQLDLEEHPVYSTIRHEDSGLDITTIESPSLGALLFQEFSCFSKIAFVLENDVDYQTYLSKAEFFKEKVEGFWNRDQAFYMDRDRDSHSSHPPLILLEQQGSAKVRIGKKLKNSARILIKIQTATDLPGKPEVIIKGKNLHKKPATEILQPANFKWNFGKGRATSNNVFSLVQSIEVLGLHASDHFQCEIVDLEYLELSQLLPLWAGMLDEEKAHQLIDSSILNPDRFFAPFGLHPGHSLNQSIAHQIEPVSQLPLTQMIIQGMLCYSYRRQAGDLFTRLINPIIQNLRNESCFRRNYNCQTGAGRGEKDHLQGIVPVNLFVEILGIKIFSPRRILIEGFSPFPWPVTINFKGLSITRNSDHTTIKFPDEQVITINDPKPRILTQEDGMIIEKSLD